MLEYQKKIDLYTAQQDAAQKQVSYYGDKLVIALKTNNAVLHGKIMCKYLEANSLYLKISNRLISELKTRSVIQRLTIGCKISFN
jgi:hypothetical protein